MKTGIVGPDRPEGKPAVRLEKILDLHQEGRQKGKSELDDGLMRMPRQVQRTVEKHLTGAID